MLRGLRLATERLGRRSTNCGAVIYAGAWISRAQTTAAISNAEAELCATGSGTCEVMLCASSLTKLGMPPNVKIRSDSTAGISAQSRFELGCVKRVDIKHLFVQSLIRSGKIIFETTLGKVGTADNASDLGTKPKGQRTLEKH